MFASRIVFCQQVKNVVILNCHSKTLTTTSRFFLKYKPSQICKLSFTLLSPFSLLKRNPDINFNQNERNKEVLANIPKDVFKKDENRHSIFYKVFAKIWTTIRLFGRTFHVAVLFGPLLVFYPIFSINEKMHERWLRMLLYAVEHSGPCFIKFGQWASSRRDIFSKTFCDLFCKLHDKSSTHSWYATKRKLKKSFGSNWRDIFIYIEKEPIGSGCIAQCHKAYIRTDMIPDNLLVQEIQNEIDPDDDPNIIDFAEGLELIGFRDNSNDFEPTLDEALQKKLNKFKENLPENSEDPTILPVAIKVLHPGIYRSVCRDLTILSSCAWFIRTMFPSLKWISIEECVNEFSNMMSKQTDLRYEANCLEVFSENFVNNPNIRFPRVIRPFCKRNVLVETFEEGEPIGNFFSDSIDTSLKNDLADHGIDALLQMIFVDNFIHGDLHPGNILVQNAAEYQNSKENNKILLIDVGDTMVADIKPLEIPLKLVLLDVGITTTLTEVDKRKFRAVFTSIVTGNGENVAELMLKHASTHQCKNPKEFVRELSALVNQFRDETLTLKNVNLSLLLGNVFKVLVKHKVKLESNFASIMIAMFVLEGIGRCLNPNLDLIAKAKPILLDKIVSSQLDNLVTNAKTHVPN